MSAVKANKAPDGGQAGALVGGAGGSDSDGEQGRITRAAGLLGGLTFVSRVAGLARDIDGWAKIETGTITGGRSTHHWSSVTIREYRL